MRYFLFVQGMLSKTLTVLALSSLSLQAWAAPSIKTKSKRKGHYVSDSKVMKAWLKKMPAAIKEIDPSEANITHIDIKWKQSKNTKVIAKSKRKAPSYTCTLQLTIKYESLSNGEAAPSLVATPDPLTVNSRCDTFLAKNDIETIVRSNTSS